MSVALLVIDMLNPYEHEDADALAESVATVVRPLSELIAGARETDGVGLIYVNDHYEDFGATRQDLVRRALDGRLPDLVEPLVPPEGCDFLQKVRHSAFYGTPLDHLLRRREIDTLILTGQVNRAVHPLQRPRRLRPPLRDLRAARRGRAHRPRTGRRGIDDDRTQHAREDRRGRPLPRRLLRGWARPRS
jgi:hypothetical protein